MNCRRNIIVKSVVSVMILGLSCQQAIAQSQDGVAAIEEIIVTAQKREQNINDVPIAITSVSGDELERLEYTDARDLVAHVPGLSWVGAISKPSVAIRGVGNNDFQSSSFNPVNMYVDGVLQGSSFGISNVVHDLERVEVLKGPQGTLWGRNSTAGLINFVPKKAVIGEEVNGYASATIGRFEQFEVDGAVSVPLSENTAARISVKHAERDGPFDSINPAYEPPSGGWDFDSARINIVSDLTDKLGVDVTVSNANLESSPQPNKNLGVAGGCANPGVLGTTCADGGGFVNTAGFFDIGTGFETFERVDRKAIALKLNYDLGFADLISITAYNDTTREALQDNDASPSQLSEGNFQDDYEGFSQEIRLQGELDSGLNWVLGAFYYSDQLTWYRSSVRATASGEAGARMQDLSNETLAAFGEVDFDVTDRLHLTFGVRITDEEITADSVRSFNYTSQLGVFNSQTQVFLNRVTPFAVNIDDFSRDDTEWSGRVAALYSVTDNTNLWGTVARGFKGGNANGGATAKNEDFNISAPEFLTSYEAGIKTTALDNRLRLAASGYFYDYEDKQIFVIEPSGGIFGNVSVLGNAGALDIFGVDIEADMQFTEEFGLSFGASYIDSEFKEFETLSRGGAVIDFAGNTTANTPEFSFDAIASFDKTLASGGMLGVQVDVVFRDDVFFGDDNRFFDPSGANVKIGQDAYTTVGANVTYTSPDDQYYVRLWGKNLTEEEYYTGGFDFSFRGALLFNIGEPRSYGITAGVNF